MATPTYLDGFECQSLLAHGGSTSGTPAVVAGGSYGSYVLQCAPAGAACWAKTPTTGVFGGTYAVHRFRFRFTSALPAANVSELAVWFTPGSDFALGFVQASGKLELRKRQNAVGTGISSANAITAGQWYLIEVRLYVGATTWTGDWMIDGTAQTQVSWAEGATNTFDSYEFGTSTTDTYSAQFDDSLCSATSTDYPLGDGKILDYGIGNTSGTHNQTAGDLKDDASANVTNGDGSGVKLAEATPDTTTFIQQVVARATTYWEGIYQTSGATETPTDVCQLVAVKNVSGTQANNEKAQLYDGTAAADAYALTSIGSTSLVYRRKVWTAAPSTGAWTLAKFQACRLRWGFSTDVAPVPAISWSILEANFTVASSTPVAASDAGIGADTSSAPAAAIAASDAGTGSDAVTDRAVSLLEAGTGADSAAGLGLATSDAATGADGNAAVSVPIAATDAGAGAEASSLAAALAGSAEAGTGADSATSVGLGASDAATASDLAAGVGLAAADAASAADGGPVIGLASSDTGVGSDPTPTVQQTGADQSIAASDTATGADAATLTVSLAGADAGTAADAQPGPGLATLDAGVGAEALRAIEQLRTEAAAASEAASLAAALAGADAGAASDVQPGPGIATSDAATGAEGVPAIAQSTTDVGGGQETAALTAAGATVEAGTAADAATLSVSLLASEAGAAGEAASVNQAAPTLISAQDAGAGADSAAGIGITSSDGSSGAGYDKLIVTYDRAWSIEDVVTDRFITVSDAAHAYLARYLATPVTVADPFFRHRPIVAVSLYSDLLERYGPVEGRRIYYEMEAQRKGPFGAGRKYEGGQPQPRSIEVGGVPPAQRH